MIEEEERQLREMQRRQAEEDARRLQQLEEDEALANALVQKMFTCAICMEELPIDDVFEVEACGHQHCLPCMNEYLKDKITSQQTRNITCPGCKEVISQNQMLSILDGEVLQRFHELEFAFLD